VPRFKVEAVLKRFCSITVALLFALTLSAETTFGRLDLSEDDTLLFEAVTEAPGSGTYTALFAADLSGVPETFSEAAVAGGDILDDAPLSQLTYYPELMNYLPELGQVQIQNRFGVFRGDVETGAFQPVAGSPGFLSGSQVETGRLVPTVSSPDGRYLTVLEPTSAAYGRLILARSDGSSTHVVAERVELSTRGVPARWSPDSRFFVYARGQQVYYFSIPQYERNRLLTESFRQLGEGTINNVRWAPDGTLFYVTGTLVYQVEGAEFFTRSLYSGLLQVGTIRGKLPFEFDGNFDSFWIAPSGENLLLNKGGRNLFALFLDSDDFVDEGQILALPALFLPRNTRIERVAWSDLGDVTIVAGNVTNDVDDSEIFRLRVVSGARDLSFERVGQIGTRSVLLSPDEQTLALLSKTGISFRSTATFQELQSVAVNDPLHAVWIDDERLLVGGVAKLEIVSVSGERSFLALAQTDDHSVSNQGEILATSEGENYRFIRTINGGIWEPTEQPLEQRKEVAAADFRVFLETLNSGSYRNIVMVRRSRGVGTSRLFPPPEVRYEPLPIVDEPVDLAYFTHGSRTREREVSLVFNAIDSVEGLTEILMTLAAYDLRATFFVNGEFIRRHPTALSEIATAGHEVGSLFFAHFDMADRRFEITQNFILEGLSRNEDEYFAATRRELSLIWHAPYYYVSDDVVEWGQEANYIYVGRDVDSLDWVPRIIRNGLNELYMPSADLIERILDVKRPGSIVSMEIGVASSALGGREDYLFQRLDVLINGLLAQGYGVVPISTLLENAR